MGLAHRIIPTILCRGRALVKGIQFNNWRSVGLAAQAVRIHAARGVDEIALLDTSATMQKREPDYALVEELSEVLFMPLAVGGGIRTIEHIRSLLRAGADQVIIGTATDLIAPAAALVGSQAIIASVDVKNGTVRMASGTIDTRMEPVRWAQACADAGAGEILLQSIDLDGTMQGYDLELIKRVRAAVQVPIIASGGCRDYENMHQAILAGADAVAAGALFQFTDATPRGAAQYLHQRGVEVRC